MSMAFKGTACAIFGDFRNRYETSLFNQFDPANLLYFRW